uniref:Uncharacterized protein n=1 Tax=Ditylenchus dipsaci TaxID=166011 RepID=A0A915CM73_9BILA
MGSSGGYAQMRYTPERVSKWMVSRWSRTRRGIQAKVASAHISAYIYTTRKQYVELLDCCLLNKLDQAHVFSVAQDLLAHLRDNELDSVKNHLQSNINKLNAIDSYRTAKLVLDNFPDFFGQTERISFVLLKNCFEIRRNKGMHSISSDEELDENLFGAYFEGTINKSKTCPEVLNEELDKQMTYLLSYWLPIGSRTDYCLNLAVANDLLETSVMLLVSRRFVGRAFEMLFERVVKEHNSENISNQISMILNLCNSYQIEAKENEWLVKLFHFLLSSKDLASNHFDNYLLDVFTSIVEGGCSGAEQVIDELFSHPSFRDAQYFSFSKLIE